jgi:hypothetical protein
MVMTGMVAPMCSSGAMTRRPLGPVVEVGMTG